jgi:phosphoglycerate dehydrogenase-like enzyme
MEMKFVFYTDPKLNWKEKIDLLNKEFPEVEFIAPEKRTDRDVEEAHAVVGMIPPDHLQRTKQLKMIFVSFTGPNMFPLDEFRKRGIRISNTHGNARYVAERAVSLVLAFYGKIPAYHEDLQNAKWHGLWGKGGLQDTWESIQEKRCAIIGTGEIGKWIAKFLKVFDCHVTGFKKKPVKGPMEYFDEIFLDLKKSLEKSEIIFVTLPLTDETEGMINADILSGLQGRFIVNVGRGGVIEEEALYNALRDGVLKGAGLDVWYTYPERGTASGYPSVYPFHELPNVILSPHVGGFVTPASLSNLDQTIENIRSYLKTGRPLFEIDLESKY